jgi:hypothetical protein
MMIETTASQYALHHAEAQLSDQRPTDQGQDERAQYLENVLEG